MQAATTPLFSRPAPPALFPVMDVYEATGEVRNGFLDGWNVVAELNGNNTAVRTYLWGSDLSGSMQGAGGVGGLLAVNNTADSSTHFVSMDGNGNCTALVNADTGALSAEYDFGPFGECVKATGAMAKLNPFRFSTKYQDDESGLLDYTFRFYDPNKGRWLSRDPVGDPGFIKGKEIDTQLSDILDDKLKADSNLYLFVANNPLSNIDLFGLEGKGCCGQDITKSLRHTLLEIQQVFWGWSESQKKSACHELYNVAGALNPMNKNYGAINAWDIQLLFDTAPPAEGEDSCKGTFTYKGKCYYANAMNYAMWGVVNRSCNEWRLTSESIFGATQLAESAVSWAVLYKKTVYSPSFSLLNQVKAMVRHGYLGTLDTSCALGECEPSSSEFKEKLDWVWEPNKPRGGGASR